VSGRGEEGGRRDGCPFCMKKKNGARGCKFFFFFFFLATLTSAFWPASAPAPHSPTPLAPRARQGREGHRPGLTHAQDGPAPAAAPAAGRAAAAARVRFFVVRRPMPSFVWNARHRHPPVPISHTNTTHTHTQPLSQATWRRRFLLRRRLRPRRRVGPRRRRRRRAAAALVALALPVAARAVRLCAPWRGCVDVGAELGACGGVRRCRPHLWAGKRGLSPADRSFSQPFAPTPLSLPLKPQNTGPPAAPAPGPGRPGTTGRAGGGRTRRPASTAASRRVS
jgi:hypothetical protein